MSDHIVTSASGKKITLKRPEVLAQLRLVDAIGDSASNRVYLAMCLPLMYVADIDGVPVHLPASGRRWLGIGQHGDCRTFHPQYKRRGGRCKKISRDAGLRQILTLTKAGVPWEVANSLSPQELLGFVVAAGEITGRRFNWGAMDWEKSS
jgi:hypothetical protein